MSTIKKLTTWHQSQLGYLEKASGSQLDSKTGNAGRANYTKYGRDFGWNGVAWCAIYQWTANHTIGMDTCVPKSASCYAWVEYFTSKQRFYKRGTAKPQEGDVVLFSSPTYPNGGAHIGYVTRCDGTYVYTIEGNTSSGDNTVVSNGGGVFAKKYLPTNSRIYGYGRPDYPEEDDEVTQEQFEAMYKKMAPTYERVEDVPDWGKDIVQKLVDLGALKGDGNGLSLTEDLLRMLVIADRTGALG